MAFDNTYLTEMSLSIYMFCKNWCSVRHTLINGENRFYLYFLRFRQISEEKKYGGCPGDCVLTNGARKVHGHEITFTLVPRNVMIF